MTKTFAVPILALLLAVAGAMTLAATTAPPTSTASTVVVPIAQQNKSGQTGSATLTSTSDGKTQVVIALTGEPSGASEPTHIHQGTCKKLNPKPAYPLNDIVNGASTTTVDVPLATLQASQFSVNAHQSTTNIGTYVACGEIPSSAAPASGAGSAATATPGPMMSQNPNR